MSRFADDMVDLHARLRLVCEAIGIEPEDVRVTDLCWQEQDRLRFRAEDDFRATVSQPAHPMEKHR